MQTAHLFFIEIYLFLVVPCRPHHDIASTAAATTAAAVTRPACRFAADLLH
jgi:hypothetical protein